MACQSYGIGYLPSTPWCRFIFTYREAWVDKAALQELRRHEAPGHPRRADLVRPRDSRHRLGHGLGGIRQWPPAAMGFFYTRVSTLYSNLEQDWKRLGSGGRLSWTAFPSESKERKGWVRCINNSDTILQTWALPLGYRALTNSSDGEMPLRFDQNDLTSNFAAHYFSGEPDDRPTVAEAIARPTMCKTRITRHE
jgi:hypothetical protein